MNHKLRRNLEAARKCGSRRAGFTLIELAFVILTCALLGCLVAPGLARSSDGGKRAVCLNNLRRLGGSMMMYGNDNRDYLPPANWGATAGSPPGWLYTVLNGSVPDPGPGGNYATNPIAAFATGLLFPYTRDPRTYLCPVDIQSKTYTATAAGAHRAVRLSSYILNGSVCGFGFSPSVLSCKVTDAWNPGCYLLWGPDEYANGPSNPGIFAFNDGANFPSTSEGSIERLHSITGGLILTVGGSVPFVSVQKFTKESTTAAKNLAYWSPFSSNGH